jgi:hypothetical protein
MTTPAKRKAASGFNLVIRYLSSFRTYPNAVRCKAGDRGRRAIKLRKALPLTSLLLFWLSFPQGICFCFCFCFCPCSCFSGLSFRAQRANLLPPVFRRCHHNIPSPFKSLLRFSSRISGRNKQRTGDSRFARYARNDKPERQKRRRRSQQILRTLKASCASPKPLISGN